MLPVRRRILMAAGTVSCALATGYLMQQDSPYRNPNVVISAAEAKTQPSAPYDQTDANPKTDNLVLESVESIALTSALPGLRAPHRLPEAPKENANTGRTPLDGAVLPATPEDPEVPQLGCAVIATATSASMANVALSVEAPCYGNQRVSVHHNGMIFTEVTSEAGTIDVIVPALSENAVFVVAFANGKGAVAMAKVPDIDTVERVALQWTGDAGFQIHAREFGAGYGEDGHVSSAASTSGQGIMTRLGRADTFEPKLAEVYTFPRDAADQSGTVTLSVETEVTANNCGREFSAQSLELRGSFALRTRELALSIPGCDASGDFLVLNNLVEDLKIASK